ncbi:hypothetical protein BDW62DRAFT_202360 [Aspergillus aurantiobrunneus]
MTCAYDCTRSDFASALIQKMKLYESLYSSVANTAQPIDKFNPEDHTLRTHGTLTDLLSHRSGLQGSNFWLGSQNNVLFPAEDALKVVNALHMAHPFRSAWNTATTATSSSSTSSSEPPASPRTKSSHPAS